MTQDDIADQPFYVVGLATRTTNADEGDPGTSRLAGLWQRAYADDRLAALRKPGGPAFVAVLTDYESDHTGAYTEIVGVRADSVGDLPEGLVAVFVPAETRQVVPARGAMPDALIQAWQQVWQQTGSGELRRGYRTDYEVHTDGGADIHLSTG